MAATGATSARSAELATLVTRSAKDPTDAGATTVGLRQRWLAQVDGLGLAPTARRRRRSITSWASRPGGRRARARSSNSSTTWSDPKG